MFGEEKNLTDNGGEQIKGMSFSPVPYSSDPQVLSSLPKLNKLISAVYMVTDIMDREEPMRLKLRTFSTDVLSDIHSLSRTDLSRKIQTILSFLEVASTVSLISEMKFII